MRVPDWPAKLAECLERARSRPYRIGEWDCALFAIEVVREITGQDYGAALRGRYNTEIGAAKIMLELAGKAMATPPPERGNAVGLLRAAVAALTGWPERSPRQGRRGDLMLYEESSAEHLGICNGAMVAVLGEGGLRWVGLSDCTCSWTVD